MLDDYTKSQIINIFGIFIGLAALIIAGYAQFQNPKTGTIFFISILGSVLLYFIISYPIAILKQKFNQIDRHNYFIFEIKKDLNKIKDNINMIMDNAKLGARLSFLESKMKNKKGQFVIDPRWILIGIIILLVILYLRSKGYL